MPQLGRAGADAQFGFARLLQLAGEIEQRMVGGFGVRGGAGGRQRQQARDDDGQRAFQAGAFKPLRPPRSERHSRNPCERSRSAAAALRLPVAQMSR